MRVFLLLILLSSNAFADLHRSTAEGFHWYTANEEPKEEVISKPTEGAIKEKVEPYQELMAKRRQAKNDLAEALLRPNFNATKKYMETQKEIAQRDQKFVMYWEQVLHAHPELDYSLTHPTDNSAIEEKNRAREQFLTKMLDIGSKKFGVIYFYKGKNFTSNRFAPVLQNFIEKYHFALSPISTDGVEISSLKNSRFADPKVIEAKLGIKSNYMPALFLVDFKTKSLTPLSYGFISETNLKNRFLDVVTNFKRHSYEGLGEGS